MSDRPIWRRRIAAPALLLALAAGMVVGDVGGVRLAAPAGGPADEVASVLDAVANEATVLVGFDPDIGTYAEVRPTVRALLADLIDRGARLAIVSLTPEGRALALAELDRLDRAGDDAGRVVDLGFVPGAEAGLVRLAQAARGTPAGGLGARVADELNAEPSLAVVVGGNDLGPRTWVEQFRPRAGAVELVAVVPTVLLPETRPLLASGQLAALLGTPRDGAAYRATVDVGASRAALLERDVPVALAVLLAMLGAIAWLGWALVVRLGDAVRPAASGDGE